MEFAIITGMSGAGKSLVAKYMEDLGYFCVDNIPPALIPKFAEVISQSEGKIKKVALVIDARGGDLLKEIFEGLAYLERTGITYRILFLEASESSLIKRYKETRRSHPLDPFGRLVEGIKNEKKMLADIRGKSHHVIDTSSLSVDNLKQEIKKIFLSGREYKGIVINIISFGFKYGIPLECDLIFDVRFIPNPFYIKSMKKLTGNNEVVKNYVLGNELTIEFLDKLREMLEFLIPNYTKEGKSQLIIGIGCTGGRHRSVAIGNWIYEQLLKKDHTTILDHRDIEKDIRRRKNENK